MVEQFHFSLTLGPKVFSPFVLVVFSPEQTVFCKTKKRFRILKGVVPDYPRSHWQGILHQANANNGTQNTLTWHAISIKVFAIVSALTVIYCCRPEGQDWL